MMLIFKADASDIEEEDENGAVLPVDSLIKIKIPGTRSEAPSPSPECILWFWDTPYNFKLRF